MAKVWIIPPPPSNNDSTQYTVDAWKTTESGGILLYRHSGNPSRAPFAYFAPGHSIVEDRS